MGGRVGVWREGIALSFLASSFLFLACLLPSPFVGLASYSYFLRFEHISKFEFMHGLARLRDSKETKVHKNPV